MPIWRFRVVARPLIAGRFANRQRAAEDLLGWLLGKHLDHQKYHSLEHMPGTAAPVKFAQLSQHHAGLLIG